MSAIWSVVGLLGQLVDGLPGVKDLLRHAVLAVDSDLPPDPGLFLAAAYRATMLTDLMLAERLARAARDGGAGFETQLLAFLVSFQIRGEEAEQELVRAAALADSDSLRLRVAIARAVNLHLLLVRMDKAHAVLRTAERLAGAEVELLGVRALLAIAAGRLEEAEHAGQRALDAPRLSVQAESYAAWALTAVAGLCGDRWHRHPHHLGPVHRRAHPDRGVHPHQPRGLRPLHLTASTTDRENPLLTARRGSGSLRP